MSSPSYFWVLSVLSFVSVPFVRRRWVFCVLHFRTAGTFNTKGRASKLVCFVFSHFATTQVVILHLTSLKPINQSAE